MKTQNRSRYVVPCFLSVAIASALLAPDMSHATEGQQIANGVDLNLLPDDYATNAAGAHVLWAQRGGTINASGPINAMATGASSAALRADGLGSEIQLGGGHFATTNDSSTAIMAMDGGNVVIGRDANGNAAAVSTDGLWSSGAWSSGNGSSIHFDGVDVSTQGIGAIAARVDQGATLDLQAGTLITTGDNADGVSITYGAKATVSDTTISAGGDSARGITVTDSGSVAQISRTQIDTAGREGIGMYLGNGAAVNANSTLIRTTGDFAYGIQLDGSARADLDHLTIHTEGQGASALWSPGAAIVNASGLDIETHGYNALGIDNRQSSITLDGGSILTTGDASYGLYASKEYSSDAIIDARHLDVRTEGASAGVIVRLGGAISLSDSHVGTLADNATAVMVGAGSTFTAARTSLETTGAHATGLLVQNASATATITRGQVLTQGADAYGVVVGNGGTATLSATDVHTVGERAWAGVVDGAGSTLNMDAGSLISEQGAALFASGGTRIELSNGTQVIGGNGTLLDVDAASDDRIKFTLDNQVYAQGDIVWSDTDGQRQSAAGLSALTDVSMTGGSQWRGATDAVDDLSLSGGSVWTLTGDSTVGKVELNDATIAFAPPVADTYKTLNVAGNFSGSGGVVAINTSLNEGGALSNQHTDRLLIQGDVATTGTTWLDVTPQGSGALTDLNKNQVVDANEGISLVQVGGSSRADAFALKGGYVAVGPWQYTLHAFGPGETDASQNALASGELNWDYRLGNKYVSDSTGPVDPTDPTDPPVDPPGPPIDPPIVRPAVVPQLPSYIVAPTALLNYGGQMIDTLHQRLGEIRNVAFDDSLGGEVFARYIGGQQHYQSDRGFADYGYDFDQQINALQLGGSLIGWNGEHASLRTGWAFDTGSTRVTPPSVDGGSYARYDANGFSAWMTWQQENGFYVDGVVGGDRYQGKVSTSARGSDVATLQAHGWTASVETGYPFAIANGWSLEPQLQLKYQSLTFRDIEDVDGLLTRIAPVDQTTARVGLRIAKTDNLRFAPYARVDLIRSIGGRAQISTSSAAWEVGNTFAGGRLGTSYRIGAGLTSQLTPHIALYGEGDYLHDTAGHGLRGWAADAGVRINF